MSTAVGERESAESYGEVGEGETNPKRCSRPGSRRGGRIARFRRTVGRQRVSGARREEDEDRIYLVALSPSTIGHLLAEQELASLAHARRVVVVLVGQRERLDGEHGSVGKALPP